MKNNPKILIVDDKIENLMILEKVLAEQDVDFVRATSGNEALAMTLKHEFALALVDAQMPEMDGFETVELIHYDKKTKYLPVIFITAVYDEPYYQIRGIETGAVDFIIKPLIPEILVGKVRVFLDLYQQKKELERKNQELIRSMAKRRQAEKQLRFQAQLLDSVRESVVGTDLEGRVIYWGRGAETLYGYRAEEVMGKLIIFIVEPQNEAEEKERMRLVCETNSWHGQYMQKRRDGTLFWADTFISLVTDESGQPYGLIGIDHDITKRMQTEKELKKSEARWRHLVQNIPAFIAEIDLEGMIVSLNKVQPGFSLEDFVGKSIIDISRPVLQDILKARFPHDVGDGISVQYATQDLGPHRTPTWYQVQLAPITMHGETVSFIMVITDITEAKQAEELLRKSEERLRSFMEAATEGFILFDSELNYIMINEAGMKFFPPEITSEDVIGENILNLIPGLKETGRYDQYLRVLETGEPFFADNDQYRDIRLIIRAFKVGNNLGMTVVDITERVQAEAQIKTSLKEKEMLLREVHHRVKNNLQIISGLLDMSGKRATQPEVVDLLTESQARIHTMALIHAQLYQSDRFDRVDLGHYLQQLVGFIEQIYTSQSKAITTNIKVAEVTLSLTQAIPCALALNEVLVNAYRHAFQEEQSGTIQISVRRSSDDTIIICVKDDGVGLPEEVDIDTIDSLGLKLVKGLIQDQLRGQVQLERNQGTQVTMEFKIDGER